MVSVGLNVLRLSSGICMIIASMLVMIGHVTGNVCVQICCTFHKWNFVGGK
jgi:hypothetical protein